MAEDNGNGTKKASRIIGIITGCLLIVSIAVGIVWSQAQARADINTNISYRENHTQEYKDLVLLLNELKGNQIRILTKIEEIPHD